MLRRTISLLLIAVALLGLLAGCKKSTTISVEEAQQIVLDDLGVLAGQVTMHPHVGEFKGEPCYCIYVTIDGHTLEYLIDSKTGEILSTKESNHQH